jgi:hypothetical protein
VEVKEEEQQQQQQQVKEQENCKKSTCEGITRG